MNAKLIQTTDFGISISNKKIFSGINFTFHKGERISILGKSGSGKTTLLLALGDYLFDKSLPLPIMLEKGKIQHQGNISRTPNTKFALVSQNPSLFEWLNVLENILLPIALEYNTSPKKLSKSIAPFLHLNHNPHDSHITHSRLTKTKKRGQFTLDQKFKVSQKLPFDTSFLEKLSKNLLSLTDQLGISKILLQNISSLSGGEAQRVSLARVFLSPPDILLLDEPFSALDELTRETLQQSLLSLCNSNKDLSVLLVTHSIDEALLLTTKAIVLSQSSILIQTPTHSQIRALIQ